MPKVINTNVLNVLKSQYRHAERFSSDIFVDIAAAKNFFDYFNNGSQSTIIQGYIQDIRMNKFGILLYCEKQVNIWVINFYTF